MAYFLFKCWHEQLFALRRENFKKCDAHTDVTYIPINSDNINEVEKLRGAEYVPQFRFQLDCGDFGYYVCKDGVPVGYGWVKRPGSSDYFFKIGVNTRYLCRFFVCEEMRGLNIYPSVISKLIISEKDCDCFYITAERGNDSSVKGLKKVGFLPIKEYGFIRGFKKTLNMKKLNYIKHSNYKI